MFSLQKKGKYGRTSRCKDCLAASARSRYEADPEKYRELSRAATKAWNQRNPGAVALARRRQHLMRLYKLTPEQFDDMLAAQGGVCAICGTAEPGGRTSSWHVDHDHETKLVRGILCHHCNTALGLARDDAALLIKMAEYLLKTSRVHRDQNDS